MAYQEEQNETRRVVVETPNARREVVHSEAVRYPERNSSSGIIAAIIVGCVVIVATMIILFTVYRQQDQTDANIAASNPPPTVVEQQPAQQPIIIQPASGTQPAPIIINNPPAGSSNLADDIAIQGAIDKKLRDDPSLSSLTIFTTVVDAKATITGTVNSETLKRQAEQAVRTVKGVKAVDNQITVS